MWFPHVFLTCDVCVGVCDFSAIFQMCNSRPLSSHTGFTRRHVISKGQHRHGEHLRPRYRSEWAEGKVYTVSPFFKHDPFQWLKRMPEHDLMFWRSHKLKCKPSLGNVCLHLVRCPTWICHRVSLVVSSSCSQCLDWPFFFMCAWRKGSIMSYEALLVCLGGLIMCMFAGLSLRWQHGCLIISPWHSPPSLISSSTQHSFHVLCRISMN